MLVYFPLLGSKGALGLPFRAWLALCRGHYSPHNPPVSGKVKTRTVEIHVNIEYR